MLVSHIFFGLGFDKVAELLVERGADINIQGQGGHTALNWAAYGGNMKSFTSLIHLHV